MFSDSDANGGPKAMLSLGRRLLLYTPAHVRTRQYAQRLMEAQLQLRRRRSCGQQSSSCGLVASGWCNTAHRLSLLYYLSLLQYVTRLLLYSLLRGAYTRYDPLMAVLDALTTWWAPPWSSALPPLTCSSRRRRCWPSPCSSSSRER